MTFPSLIFAQSTAERRASDTILLTIFLRHDQSLNLTEIQKLQEEQGFWKAFPPEGTTVISWYVMMGIGQVVTLEVPASKLRDVNLALEKQLGRHFARSSTPPTTCIPSSRTSSRTLR